MYTAGGVEAYTQRGFILFAYALSSSCYWYIPECRTLAFYDTDKSIENTGMPEKS
jgi:hypothetical protein